jgi:hypothetical protein
LMYFKARPDHDILYQSSMIKSHEMGLYHGAMA